MQCFIVLALSTGAFAYDFPMVADTSGDVKDTSQFVTYRVDVDELSLGWRVPADWVISRKPQPHLVTEIISDEGKGTEICNITVNEIPSHSTQAQTTDDFIALISNQEFARFVPQGYTLLSGQQISVSELPAAQIIAMARPDNAADNAAGNLSLIEKEFSRLFMFSYVYHNARYIIVTCATQGETTEDALTHFKASLPRFAAIVNSISVVDP